MQREQLSYKPIILLILLVFTRVLAFGESPENNAAKQATKQLKRANAILDADPDSSFTLFQKALSTFEHNDDKHHIIQSHIGISDVYKNKGQYSKAYDHLWDALILAEETQDTSTIILINRDLGRLYSIYEKYDKAHHRFSTALAYAKKYNDFAKVWNINLHNLYYSLAVNYRKSGQYDKALNYLDSCSISTPNKDRESAYVNVEKGYIYLSTGEYEQSEQYLLTAHRLFKSHNRSYQIISALHLGDLNYKQKKWSAASQYYQECLTTLESFTSHGDVKVKAHRRLAESLSHLQQTKSAYLHLNEAMLITDSLFNAKTTINNELFQIKNKYKETIQEKNKYIHEQELIIEQKNIIQSRLILFIAFVCFILLALVIFVRMRHQLHKSALAKREVELQAQLDQEKTAEIIDIKNKELTASTLKIIEKEQTIEELLTTIKKDSPLNYKKLKIKSSVSSKDMWEQFNMRFVEVNAHFYDNLRKKFPNLTPTEHKHCALIKLNFDSKEMASLLNISLSSVHISRHRIRKKMELDREDSLSNYIASIS